MRVGQTLQGLLRKRENRIRDYLGKTAKRIINYCLEHNIGNLVLGKNKGFQQKTLSEREQKIYNMICENLHLSVEQVMAELDISRATVFRDYAKIKKVTGAMYDKKTSRWTLD